MVEVGGMKTVESSVRDAGMLSVADSDGEHDPAWDQAWAGELDKRSADADPGFESWSTPTDVLAETKQRLGVE